MGENLKSFNLEERTYEFAYRCREFAKQVSKTISNLEYLRQLIRSSGSVAANYIEANDRISKKDFYLRIRICRKEAKESRLWLRLIEVEKDSFRKEQNILINEAFELTKIFGAIVVGQK